MPHAPGNPLATGLQVAFELPQIAVVSGEGSKMRVHSAVSRFAFLYERVRNAVEYRDEHLHRKAAIIRILKRHLVLERDPQHIAGLLLRELIGARYLENNSIPETAVMPVAERIRKFQQIQGVRLGGRTFEEWLLGVTAAEIEEYLAPGPREKALATFLYERLADKIQFEAPVGLEASDLKLQVYLAVFRTYSKADGDLLSWKLVRAYFPDWLHPERWIEAPQATAERMLGIERRVQLTLRHPLSPIILRAVRPWSVVFRILEKALSDVPSAERANILNDLGKLERKIAGVIDGELKEVRARLRRGAARAMLYLFLTKMVIGLVLEIPLERWIFGQVDQIPLFVNMVFPPILMFLVALFIRVPGKDNVEALKKMALSIVSKAGPDPAPLRLDRKRSWGFRILFGTVYFGLSFLIFSGLIWGLTAMHFTWVSTVIFLFFLCLVSFFAFRLRNGARDVFVISNAERATSIIIDLASLPILRVGQALSAQLRRFNIFQFFFDFLFEAPFKLFLTILEEWFSYLKEKKEALQ